MDITGVVLCQVVKSQSTRGCADADKEEWDIIDTEADAGATARPPQYLQNNEVISDNQTFLKLDVSGETAKMNDENPQTDTSTASTRTVNGNLHHE